jgi:hypothetical protein
VFTQTLSAHLLTDPSGVIEAPASPDPRVVIHVGPSVKVECKRGGQTHRGTAIHGDVDILPAHTESRWTIWERDTALIVRIPQTLLTQVAQESEIDPAKALRKALGRPDCPRGRIRASEPPGHSYAPPAWCYSHRTPPIDPLNFSRHEPNLLATVPSCATRSPSCPILRA